MTREKVQLELMREEFGRIFELAKKYEQETKNGKETAGGFASVNAYLAGAGGAATTEARS